VNPRRSTWEVLLLVLAALGLLALACCESAWPTELEYVPPPLFDSSDDGSSTPFTLRSQGVALLNWEGGRWLVHNTGNDLELIDVANMENPSGRHTRSHFHTVPIGDRDFWLSNFFVCEGCRFGTAGFDSVGTVLFDLGASPSGPYFAQAHYYQDVPARGAFTFKHAGQQYLISSVRGECPDEQLTTFSGTNLEALRPLQCLSHGVDGGFVVGEYLYLVDSSGGVRCYRMLDVGTALVLEPLGRVLYGRWNRGRSVDVDGSHAVTVSGAQGIQLWDIANPAAPVPLGVAWNPAPQAGLNTVALSWPYLWVSSMGITDAYTFDVSDPAHPVPVDPEFWDPAHPWNAYPYSSHIGAVWADDWLVLSRMSVVERVRLVQTAPPEEIFQNGFESGDSIAWRTP
jgi:hypothetical protein